MLSRPADGELEEVAGAFSSRSMTRPHASQVNVRSASVRLGFRRPHAEHVFELGYQRLAVMTCPPFHGALQPSICLACPNPWSETARASRRFEIIPVTFRSSITTVS
jgi:hypothetical protein